MPQFPTQNGLKLSVDQCSSQGIKSCNEDSVGIRIPDQNLLYTKGAVALVADGVSAAEFGKEAAQACVMSFMSDYFSTPDAWTVKKSAHKVLVALNRWLFGQGLKTISEGMAYVCTLSALIVRANQAHLFHVGDSRIYLFRDGDLAQLTEDHTVRVHEDYAYLAKAMGMSLNVEIDYRSIDIQPGDIFLLTTDGFHDFVATRQLFIELSRLKPAATFDGMALRLVQKALANNSDDNISCQIIRVDQIGRQLAMDKLSELERLPCMEVLKPGQSLDGLRITRVLKDGDRYKTYLAQQSKTSQPVVLKAPTVGYIEATACLEQYLIQEWVISRVQNQHIVSGSAATCAPSRLYLLLEYFPGVPLDHWIRDNSTADIHRIVLIIEQIAKAIRALRRKEVLHRNIEPENILIDNNDRVKLVGFGSCWAPGLEAKTTTPDTSDASKQSQFLAPECLLGDRGTHRSEIFSVAVICYQMLTGRHPYGTDYAATSSEADFYKLRYTPSNTNKPLIPDWFEGAMNKALSLDPKQRYESFSEWLYDLKHPNKKLTGEVTKPLMEKSPERVWQCLAAILLFSQLITLYLLTKA